MKLNGIIPLLCVMTFLSGCSGNEDSPESHSAQAIEFDNIHVNNLTRNATSKIPFSKFEIYGFIDSPEHYLYEGAIVEELTPGNWVCEQREYWYPSHDYYFTAIAPANANGVTFYPAKILPQPYLGCGTLRYRPAATDASIDLLYSLSGKIDIPSSLPTTIPAVELEFNHLLSQIQFQFYNDLGNPHYFINVPSIVIGNLNAEGEIDLSEVNPQWHRVGDDTFWANAGRVDIIKTDKPKNSSPLYILPIKMDGAVIQLQTQLFFIENQEDESGFQITDVNTYLVDFPEIDFKPGHSYTLVAHLTYKNIEGPDHGMTPISFEIYDYGWHYYMNPIDVPSQ